MPGVVQAAMDKVAALTGRQYHLFDYVGHPQASVGTWPPDSPLKTVKPAPELCSFQSWLGQPLGCLPGASCSFVKMNQKPSSAQSKHWANAL